MNKEEKFVISVLKSIGLNPIKIEEDSIEKSPDLLLECDDAKILIEVKTKFDDLDYLENKNKMLSKGEIVHESIYTTRKNNISKVIRLACDQLIAKKSKADLYLIWLMAANSNEQITIDQFVSTLYGSVDIIDWFSEDKTLKPCYYFENSEFFNHKNILDGAIVSSYEKGMICINDLSPRYSIISKSKIVEKFNDAVIDPQISENNKTGYVIDTDINRKQKDDIIKYLRNKYKNNNLGECNLGHHSGTILVEK